MKPSDILYLIPLFEDYPEIAAEKILELVSNNFYCENKFKCECEKCIMRRELMFIVKTFDPLNSEHNLEVIRHYSN